MIELIKRIIRIDNPLLHNVVSYSVEIVGVFVLGCITYYIAKWIIDYIILRIVKGTSTKIDDIIFNDKFLVKLNLILVGIVIYIVSPFLGQLAVLFEKLSLSFVGIMAILMVNNFIDSIVNLFKKYKIYEKVPLKGYAQVLQILISMFGMIIIIGILINRSPWKLVSGIGAMTAILMLVFKDTILGFVASVQLSANDMVRIGDWIEMPKYGADGNVIDITVHTVKVRNWDNTITTIPTYQMIADSFKNWRGMKESGARRIKRSLYIDVNSIKICDEELIKRFENMELIKDYVLNKKKEIEEYNKTHQFDENEAVNGRRMTNIGTFRAYLYAYLRNHKRIRQDLTILVRQLKMTEHGLPVEIYCFTNTTDWIEYENIQSDIFDHIFGVIDRFDLKVFQYPTSIVLSDGMQKLHGNAMNGV